MKFSFKRLKDFVEEANITNSTLDKIEVIKKYPDLKKLFIYVYDTMNYVYGVTSDTIRKFNDDGYINIDITLFELLDALNKRTYTGHTALRIIKSFVRNNHEYEDIIYSIIDRNLKTRTDIKLINKVWPGLIPEFNVALAETYKPEMYIDFSKTPYFASRKCDGVRLITIVKKGKIKFFSREGKEFHTLNVLKKELENMFTEQCSLSGYNFVLDGELCLMDENGKEDFQNVMKEIRKKDHTIENPKYMLFDMISLEDFLKGHSDRELEEAYIFLSFLTKDSKYVSVLEQEYIRNEEELSEMVKKSEEFGWEGLILRKASSDYEGKRTKNMLKIKKFYDAEYTVKDLELGVLRHIVDGKEISSEMLSKIIIEHKGNDVGVGSGFSMEQRLHFKDHPEDILGKVITVTYFEETQNQDGSYSLRFPTIKYIHGNERSL